MKIDVEGSEIEALEGMKSILKHNANLKILLEYSPHLIKNFGAEPKELLDFLKTNGFNFFLIDSNDLVPTDEKYLLKIPNDSECNILCKRD